MSKSTQQERDAIAIERERQRADALAARVAELELEIRSLYEEIEQTCDGAVLPYRFPRDGKDYT